jgi:hypothetical protein
MKVIIAGSRTVTDYSQLIAAVHQAASEGIVVSQVVSGMARGADSLGVQYAKVNAIPLLEFPANWAKHGKQAGYIRNADMAKVADALIALWDGKSSGTQHMICLAKAKGLKVTVWRV